MTPVHFATSKNVLELQQLLKSADLPYEDIEKHIHDFAFIKGGDNLIGCVGLEVYGEIALLRSLAVAEKHRNQGIGHILTNEIIQYAIQKQITRVFLLTTTAERFFAKLGFVRMKRDEAPEAIRFTTEFSSLCPDTAILMCKEI